MVNVLSTSVLAAGAVSAAGVEQSSVNGGSVNNLAIAASTQRLLLTNGPLASAVSFALATPVIASTVDGTVFSTAAWSPVVGQHYVIFTATTGAPSAATLVKTGLTIGSATSLSIGSTSGVQYWAALGTATTSSALTATHGASITGMFIAVVAVSGAHASASTLAAGGTSLYSVGGGGIAATGNTITASWFTPADMRALVGAVVQETNVVPTLDAGYTSLAGTTIATPNEGFAVKYKTTYDGIFTQSAVAAAAGAEAVAINPAAPGSYTITGIAGGYAGRVVVIQNLSQNLLQQGIVGTGLTELYTEDDDRIILKDQSSSSTAANRIIGPSTEDYILAGGESVTLIYDATASRWRVLGSAKPYGPIVRTYTAGATWTRPDGLAYIVVECIGSGGGGGGAGVTVASQAAVGGGGGGGGYARKLFKPFQLSSTCAITVGTGGTVSAGAAGGNGNPSSFAVSNGITVTGGAGSGGAAMAASGTAALAAGGAGGSGTSGDLNLDGGDGGYGFVISGTRSVANFGGSTFYSGTHRISAPGAGSPGGGGGGASIAASTAATAGLAGATGLVIVTEYYAA